MYALTFVCVLSIDAYVVTVRTEKNSLKVEMYN